MPPTLQERYDDALAQYHKLSTGKMARVFVDQNGERVEFTAVKTQDLWLYIQRLKSELDGLLTATPQTRGPMSFTF